MIKKIATLLPIIILLMLTGCSDKDMMNKLNGEWQTILNQYEQGEMMKCAVKLELNAETAQGQFVISASSAAMPDMMTIKIPIKKWSATDKELTIKINEENVEIDYSPAFKEVAKLSGVDLKKLQKESLKEMLKNMETYAKSNIKEVSDTELTLVEDGQATTFTRVK